MPLISIRQAIDSAVAHQQTGRLVEAENICRQILQHQPSHPGVLHLLGLALHQQGQIGPAIESYQRSLGLQPNHALLLNHLGRALWETRQLQQAESVLRQATSLQPDLVDAHMNLGLVLEDQGRFAEAEACHRQTIQLQPGNAEHYGRLATALNRQGRLEEAAEAYRRAIAIDPLRAELHGNLGTVLGDQGHIGEAIASVRHAVELAPQNAALHSNLLRALLHDPASTVELVRREHLNWAEKHARPLYSQARPHDNDRSPDRRLRIGYVSPDLRNHAIGWLMQTILGNHDHEQFEIVCYSDGGRICPADAQAQRLRRLSDVWRDTAPLDDPQLAEVIRRDRVDILVDVAAHSAFNRLLAFARKPAPVQVSYLGYPGPTGMEAMEYRVTDPYLSPPDQKSEVNDQKSEATSWALTSDLRLLISGSEGPEKLAYLPDCYWCYRQPEDCPPVNELPALRAGHVTFASLNSFAKVNDAVVALWAQVLQTVPQSRLHLLVNGGQRNTHVYEAFERHGIERQRIVLIDRQSPAGYLRLYHDVDIGLDPFPYNGHTTSYDALYMGVPLVTLAGQFAVGRAGASILPNLKLHELIAATPEEYVRIAAELAKDMSRLAELRRTLRQRMRQSPLMDGPRFVRNLEGAYREMWWTWCGADVARQYHKLGMRCVAENRTEEALKHYARAAELKPDYVDAQHNVGVALAVVGRTDDAIAHVRQALRVNPDSFVLHGALGRFLELAGHLDEAIASYCEAIRLEPADPFARKSVGGLLTSIGRVEDAAEVYDRFLKVASEPARQYSDALYLMHFRDGVSAQQIMAEHKRWGEQFALPLSRSSPAHRNDRSPHRRLRVGYLGAHFRDHVVGRNFAPILGRHDRSQFEITLYSNSRVEDELTHRMRSHGDRWRNVVSLSDEQLAEQIRADGIDILVDMAQHMDGNRMLALARKPAPVQVAHWGYPATTGLPAMDYRVSDPHLDPPGESEVFSTEKIIRLPHCFWCYLPENEQPPVGPLPALSTGRITFGSLNSPQKNSPATIGLWAQVLHRVPGSRMMLLVSSGMGAERHLLESFALHGIGRDRLEFVVRCSRLDYLRLYNQIDIGLDPRPYTGHTSSCDSFWMGVPVITLPGQTSVSRGGVSLLRNLGLPELIAATPEQYVEIAAGLAGDLPRLKMLRETMRDRMRGSPLMDAEGYTRALEGAYRAIWEA